ncbi:hypothetical protein RJ640_000947 [Escallonia rubra]|uniref:Bifunctional inhibitor/plant lipid transfer protein/seed storage helical domain-containing protein n=1 Tax=Escallonia rubra TaxID=112253 RepID=A0AA88QWV3_9ASTE|nr:hypothetical protein RJ640_000947 [Escallonia rubra]
MVLLVLTLLSMWDVKMASAAPSPAECEEEQRLGINACLPVSFYQQPPAACCERVRVSNGECICPAISPRLASRIGNDRFVRLVRGCGRSFPPRGKYYRSSMNDELCWQLDLLTYTFLVSYVIKQSEVNQFPRNGRKLDVIEDLNASFSDARADSSWNLKDRTEEKTKIKVENTKSCFVVSCIKKLFSPWHWHNTALIAINDADFSMHFHYL